MIKNDGGILNNSNIQKNSVNLRITKKNNNKPTKKVILETSILDHISEKNSKKIVVEERPEPEAVGHLSDARKEEIIAEIVAKKKAKSKKTLKQPHIGSSFSTSVASSSINSNIKENKVLPKNISTLPIKAQALHKNEIKKRTLKLNINGGFSNAQHSVNDLETEELNFADNYSDTNIFNNINDTTIDDMENIVDSNNVEEINIIDSADNSGDISVVEDILSPAENTSSITSSDETPAPKKEVSINQNSAFFYEPSIFERFNIEVSNLDEESTSIEDSSEDEEDDNEGASIEDSFEDDDFEESTSIEDSSEDEDSEENTAIEDSSENEADDDNELPSANNEETVEINDAISEEELPDEEDVLDNIIEATFSNEITEIPSNDSLENNSITKVDFTELNEEDLKKEVADTIMEPPVEKFFDSSIPNINSNTTNNSFSKAKRIPYSESSVVFKKFSYEHAPIETAESDISDDSSVFEPIQTNTTTNTVKKALVNFEKNTSLNNVPVSADTNNIMAPNIDDTIASQVNNNFDLENNTSDDIGPINLTTNLSSFSDEQLDKELEEILNSDEADEENDFSIETYFGVVEKNDEDNEDVEEFNEYDETDENKTDENSQMESFTKLIENLTQSISTLSNRITTLDGSSSNSVDDEISDLDYLNVKDKNEISSLLKNVVTDDDESEAEDKIVESPKLSEEKGTDVKDEEIIIENTKPEELIVEANNLEVTAKNMPSEELIVEDDNSEDVIIENEKQEEVVEDAKTEEVDIEETNLDDVDDIIEEINEPSLLDFVGDNNNNNNEDLNSIENILLETFNNHANINDDLKKELISEILSVEEEKHSDTSPNTASNNQVLNKVTSTVQGSEATDDLFKIIDSLSQTITELEEEPEVNSENEKTSELASSNIENENLDEELEESLMSELASVPENTDDKAINILINKDDIFSIAILNETYEIVTDFDGISVISKNLHISTPKNNFYVSIGEKYIEIHKKPDLFVVNTNFEDIEFANAINNVAFAKKKNVIELNIKEAFKITSINNKIELSMLNTSIANLTAQEKDKPEDENSSLCDNKTLLINEETQKVYLPYTLEEVMKKLNSSSEYQSLEDVIEQEYTLPLSTFKRPIISRFREAYKFMRSKENSSVYAALDLAIELMFNSNLNPAVIRASKDLKELNIYLDCLYENEIDKFDCFKILYKVLPKIK